jgi:hypothetical protein
LQVAEYVAADKSSDGVEYWNVHVDMSKDEDVEGETIPVEWMGLSTILAKLVSSPPGIYELDAALYCTSTSTQTLWPPFSSTYVWGATGTSRLTAVARGGEGEGGRGRE